MTLLNGAGKPGINITMVLHVAQLAAMLVGAMWVLSNLESKANERFAILTERQNAVIEAVRDLRTNQYTLADAQRDAALVAKNQEENEFRMDRFSDRLRALEIRVGVGNNATPDPGPTRPSEVLP